MSTRKGLIISVSRTGVQLALQVISVTVLARLLTPEEFGIAAIAVAVMAILESYRELGVARYIVKEPDLTPEKMRTVYGFSLLIGFACGALLLALRQPLIAFYDEPRIGPVVTILALTFTVVPFGLCANGMLRRRREFGALAAVNVLSLAANVAVSLLCAWAGLGETAIAYGALANAITFSGLSSWYAPGFLLLRPSLGEFRAVGAFAGMASVSGLLQRLINQLPPILIGRSLGFAEAGLFSRAMRIVQLIWRSIAGSVNWVTSVELAARFREGGNIAPMILRATDYLAVLVWPLLIFTFIEAEGVVAILLGSQWAGAVPLLQALCVAQALNVVVSQAEPLYVATGDVRLMLRNTVILLGAWIVLLLGALQISLLAVAVARIAWGVAQVMAHQVAYKRYLNIGAGGLMAGMGRAAGVSVLFGAAAWGLHLWFAARGAEAWDVPLKGLILVPVWLAAMAALRHPFLPELIAPLKRRLRG